MGFSVLAIFSVGLSVFALKTSVSRFCCPLRFPVFWPKIKQVRFLCGSLCSQMLGYFICFYFTVIPGQIAMWDSGFLIEVYNYRRAFSERKISLRLPWLFSIAVQSRIFVNYPRLSQGTYASFTTTVSIDSSDTVILKSL